MKKSNFRILVILSLLQIIVLSNGAHSSTLLKPTDNCDKITLKSGNILLVDISHIDTVKIYYVICDSTEPQYSVLKKNVQSVKYANDDKIYTNIETYGAGNNNSFGFRSYTYQYNNTSKKLIRDSTITHEGNKYYQYGQKLRVSDLNTILADCPASTKQYDIYRSNRNTGNALMLVGSLCVLTGTIINLGKTVKDANNIHSGNISSNSSTGSEIGFYLVGGALVVAGLPFALSAKPHFKEAINRYNAKDGTGYNQTIHYNLVVNTNGLGVRMRF